MTLSRLRPKYLMALASLAPCLTLWTPPATAEIFFRPFGYAFHRPIVEPEPDVSPQRIAAILARRGFRLVGPLGYRGDQIVATGVDARGARERFLVDPYEGEVLSSWRVGPNFAREAPIGAPLPPEPYGAPEAIAPGEPKVIPGLGGEQRRQAQPKAAAPKHADAPPHAKTAARPASEPAPRAVPHPPPSQATKTPPKPAAPKTDAPAPSSAPSATAPSNAPADERPPAAKTPVPPAPEPVATAPVAPPAQPAAPQTAAAPLPAASAVSTDSAASAPHPAPEQPKAPDANADTGPKSTPGG